MYITTEGVKSEQAVVSQYPPLSRVSLTSVDLLSERKRPKLQFRLLEQPHGEGMMSNIERMKLSLML